jgi:hypothetical protein
MWWTVSFPPAEDHWFWIQWPDTSNFSFSFSDNFFQSGFSGLGNCLTKIDLQAMKGENMSDQVVYTSKSRIERVKGPLRRAFLPQVKDPVLFGVHSEIAEHYGVDSNVHEPQATTLDYVVASAAG